MATEVRNDADDAVEVLAKPPFLRRVRIRGYKSIAFCDVTLEPLTILVGRNASGKSNFLDALAFLGDALRFNVSEAVNRHGGFPAILCRKPKSDTLSVEIEVGFSDQTSSYIAHYAVTFSETQDNQAVSPHEMLRFVDAPQGCNRGFEARQGKMRWLNDDVTLPSNPPWLPSDHLYLGYLGEPPFPLIANSLRHVCVYNFHPEAIRRPQTATLGYLLEPDGSNLASIIAMLQEKDPEMLARVKAYLSAIVPDIQDFWAVHYGEYLTIRFRLSSHSESALVEFDAASMSDGTLRALCSIMSAFQYVFPLGRSKVIGIEEPETSLHPAAMRALVAGLDEATLQAQVLLTTHSAEMLDNPTIRPENIRVVEMIDGQTVIGPVDEANVEIVRRGLDTLGGLERQNQLEPDLDDLDRQKHLAQNGQEPKE